MMKCLIEDVRKLKSGSLMERIESRLREFEEAGRKSSKEVFQELCFCLLTANFNAEKSIIMQERIGKGFLTLHEEQLTERLRELGHRYPNARAKYIVEARKHIPELRGVLSGHDGIRAREWLVKNVKGLGYKEASHFLRNVGFRDLAIVDFHIVDILTKHGMCEGRRPMTRKMYLNLEDSLRKLGNELGMDMAELDLYLWYCETGKVLK
jgi:N-glycosylase/DNA lyase